MTKEQEEAIEYLKKYKYDNEVYNAINIVLSMLEEKDKEISQLKKGINSLMSSREKWKNRYYKTKRELREKDKVIDLMSEQLTTPIHNKEWIKEYYENKTKEN